VLVLVVEGPHRMLLASWCSAAASDAHATCQTALQEGMACDGGGWEAEEEGGGGGRGSSAVAVDRLADMSLKG
jgi:hypothetical protein